MNIRIITFLLFAAPGATSRTQDVSPTARKMEQAGYVNIQTLAPDIPVSLMYARADNFVGRVLYADLREAYLHPSAARALAKAQQLLKKERPDLSLKVYDAARPMHIQQQMWDVVKGTPQAPYVSNPARGGGLHNYGMAVDLTLCNAQGDTIPMGTLIDHLGHYAHIDDEATLVQQGVLTPEAKRNRELLRRIMRAAGFKPLRTEWWHFNFISRAEAKARYKPIP